MAHSRDQLLWIPLLLMWKKKSTIRVDLAGSKIQAFKEVQKEQCLQEIKAIWLLLCCIDTLQRVIEKLRSLNKQLKAKCESQMASLVAYKEIRAYLQKQTKLSSKPRAWLSQELQRYLNAQQRLLGNIWDPKMWHGNIKWIKFVL